MTIESFKISVSDLNVDVTKKDIKNLHIGVYPPFGEVKIAAPLSMTRESIRLAIITRLKWIRKQQRSFSGQNRESTRSMSQGESHYFQGRRYRLDLVEEEVAPYVEIKNKSKLTLHVRPGSDANKKRDILDQWYRQNLKKKIPDLIAKWEKIIGVEVKDWGVKKMKAKWGSCNISDQRIWVNLELAKKPTECLEYIIVHEMTHLLERHHNERFLSLMDSFLPNWKHLKDLLNSLPLSEVGGKSDSHQQPA